MADKFYSVAVGATVTTLVTEGSSTSGKAIELRVSDTAYSKKIDVILGLRTILNYLEGTETSPIA